MWSPIGGELFYRKGNKMMVVAVETEPTFSAGTPKILFEGDYELDGNGDLSYDVSPDGQQFVMILGEGQSGTTEIRIVLNWYEELKRLEGGG